MAKHKPQVIIVSGFTYRDYILKSALGHDDTYGGLLNRGVEKAPTATFGLLEEHEKMLQGVPEDAQAILDYERTCGVQVKIALSYSQAFNMTDKLLKHKIPIQAFLFYRIIEDIRHNLYEVLLDPQAGFELYRNCMGMRPGPIFVVCSPRTDETGDRDIAGQTLFTKADLEEKTEAAEGNTPQAPPMHTRNPDLEAKLTIVDKIKSHRCYGILYLEEQNLAMDLLTNINKDPFTYGSNIGTVIRSREDFLNQTPVEPSPVQETMTSDPTTETITAAAETEPPQEPELAEPYTVARNREEAAANRVMRALVQHGKKQNK
ncbi:MAG: hypothetical protein V1729_03560 [Candidatus Woesearchaeota archaeon]